MLRKLGLASAKSQPLWNQVIIVTARQHKAATHRLSVSAASAEALLEQRDSADMLSADEVQALGKDEGSRQLWSAFFDLAQIPRMSRHEAAILKHIRAIADKHGLRQTSDAAGNLAVFRPGSGKGASAQPVIVQAHVDMVCEKNDDTQHDFLQDPISFREEGDWLKACGTTLGADNGLGAAAALVLMQQSQSADLPPLELLFTVEEEIGLNGAKALDNKALQLTGRRLVNMDSEEWGEICIGCAGGGLSTLTLPAPTEAMPAGHQALHIAVTGLMGGHSGLMIAEGRGNAVKCAAQVCHAVCMAVPAARLASLTGGDKHNAIPREANAVLLVPADSTEKATAAIENAKAGLQQAFGALETDMVIKCSTSESPTSQVLEAKAAADLLALAVLLPHGVDKVSHAMPGLVETSCNLAAFKRDGDTYQITISSRSSVTSSLHALRARIKLLAEKCGATVAENEIYPGWNPAPSSKLVTQVKGIYSKTFSIEPKLTAVHAGLECGILNERLGGELDMVSYGPTIHGAHSPDEAALIATVGPFWKLTEVLMAALCDN